MLLIILLLNKRTCRTMHVKPCCMVLCKTMKGRKHVQEDKKNMLWTELVRGCLTPCIDRCWALHGGFHSIHQKSARTSMNHTKRHEISYLAIEFGTCQALYGGFYCIDKRGAPSSMNHKRTWDIILDHWVWHMSSTIGWFLLCNMITCQNAIFFLKKPKRKQSKTRRLADDNYTYSKAWFAH
jgi:hypothetical protein